MKPEQDIDSLQKIADSEFDRILDSPWRRFPPASVRDELIRRLKLRSDLSLNDKKLKYKRILERFRMVVDAESWVSAADSLTEMDFSNGEKFMLRLQIQKEEMEKHQRQMSELRVQRGDPFMGKTKPGDWRPKGNELCPVCDGNGKGADRRICGKCSGRGFIRP
jgi:hypothetical protein